MHAEEGKEQVQSTETPMVVVERSIDAAFFGLTQGYMSAKPVEVETPLTEYEMVEQRIMKEFFAYLAERLQI